MCWKAHRTFTIEDQYGPIIIGAQTASDKAKSPLDQVSRYAFPSRFCSGTKNELLKCWKGSSLWSFVKAVPCTLSKKSFQTTPYFSSYITPLHLRFFSDREVFWKKCKNYDPPPTFRGIFRQSGESDSINSLKNESLIRSSLGGTGDGSPTFQLVMFFKCPWH